jgi:glycosyltransferase involved in cell wall biosynthesis
MDLSVIIPAYNMEKYIAQCLRSVTVCPEDGIEMECIVVNDGSSDETAKVVERYIQRDDRIRLINKENGGVSEARNEGIKAAKGEYIMFLDADDRLVENAWENIETVISEENADYVAFSYITQYENGKIIPELLPISDMISTDAKEARKLMYSNSVFNTCWGKLFKADIIRKNDMKFRKGLPIGEDYLFVAEYFSYCDSFFITKVAILYYLQRTGSAMRSYSITQRLDFARILYDYNLGRVETYKDEELMRDMNVYYLRVISGLFLEYANMGRGRKLRKVYCQAFENPLYQEIIGKVEARYLPSKMKKFEYGLLSKKDEKRLAFYFSLKSVVFWLKVHI